LFVPGSQTKSQRLLRSTRPNYIWLNARGEARTIAFPYDSSAERLPTVLVTALCTTTERFHRKRLATLSKIPARRKYWLWWLSSWTLAVTTDAIADLQNLSLQCWWSLLEGAQLSIAHANTWRCIWWTQLLLERRRSRHVGSGNTRFTNAILFSQP
jgi:hypothetical protein